MYIYIHVYNYIYIKINHSDCGVYNNIIVTAVYAVTAVWFWDRSCGHVRKFLFFSHYRDSAPRPDARNIYCIIYVYTRVIV